MHMPLMHMSLIVKPGANLQNAGAEWNPGPVFLSTLAKEAQAKLHDFTPQARLWLPSGAVTRICTSGLVPNFSSLMRVIRMCIRPQNISDTMMAFAGSAHLVRFRFSQAYTYVYTAAEHQQHGDGLRAAGA